MFDAPMLHQAGFSAHARTERSDDCVYCLITFCAASVHCGATVLQRKLRLPLRPRVAKTVDSRADFACKRHRLLAGFPSCRFSRDLKLAGFALSGSRSIAEQCRNFSDFSRIP